MEKLKVLIFKNNTKLISEIREVTVELGEPDCKLINPVEIDNTGDEVILKKWPEYTEQREILIHSDSILTIVDPTSKYIELYLKTIK